MPKGRREWQVEWHWLSVVTWPVKTLTWCWIDFQFLRPGHYDSAIEFQPESTWRHEDYCAWSDVVVASESFATWPCRNRLVQKDISHVGQTGIHVERELMHRPMCGWVQARKVDMVAETSVVKPSGEPD